MSRYERERRAAQVAYDNASPDESEDRRNDRIADIANDFARDDAKCAEATEWMAGEFSEQHYSDAELALFDLHSIHPADLPGHPILPRLYALADVVNARYTEWFRSEAEAQVEREIAEAEEMRDDYKRGIAE